MYADEFARHTVWTRVRRRRCGWTQKMQPIWSHSPQCAECDHVGGTARHSAGRGSDGTGAASALDTVL